MKPKASPGPVPALTAPQRLRGFTPLTLCQGRDPDTDPRQPWYRRHVKPWTPAYDMLMGRGADGG